MKLFELFGVISLKDNNINRKLDNIDKKATNIKKSFDAFAKKVAVAGTAIGTAIAGVGIKSVQLASDAAEMQSKFNTVFGEMTKDAEKWASEFRDKVGGSRVEIKGMLADSQDMLTGFGASTQEAFNFSTQIQELGTDLASFQNIQGGSAEAVERLRKGLLGETENLKALGIVINETVMKQKLQELGWNKEYKELTELEKIKLRYIIATEQSKNAIGDAEKTNRDFANTWRDIKGQIKDITAELGAKLLPKATELANNIRDNMPMIKQKVSDAVDTGIELFTKFSESIQWAKENSETLIPIILGLAAAIGALKVIKTVQGLYVAWTATTFAQTLATQGLSAAMGTLNLATGGIVLAIGAAVAAGVSLYRNWDTVKAKAIELWEAIKSVFTNINNTVVGTFDNLVNSARNWATNMIDMFVGGIKSKIEDVKNGVEKVAGVIKDFLGFSSPTKEGPASDSDKWAPNFVDMFTKGLENNAYKVRNASENLATKIADALGKVQNYVRNTVSIIENKYELWKIKNDIVADSVEDLSRQLEVQREKHNLLNKEIEATEQALNKAIEKFGEGSSEALEYRNRLLELQVAQAELGEEIENTTSKLNEQKKYFGDKISDSVYRTGGGGSSGGSESYYNSDTGEHHIFDEDGTHTIIDDDGNMRTVDDDEDDEEPGSWIGNGYAEGTDYARAGLALVGEEGPELVNFKGGEKVYTAEETQSLLGRIINNFNISQLVVREEADLGRIARKLHALQAATDRGAGVL